MFPPGSATTFANELVQAGAYYDDLELISTGVDLADASDLIAAKLYAERGEQMLASTAWTGGCIAFVVGDFVTIASLHDAVYTTAEWLAVGGLTIGAFIAAATARTFFVRARITMRRLLRIRRVLAWWR